MKQAVLLWVMWIGCVRLAAAQHDHAHHHHAMSVEASDSTASPAPAAEIMYSVIMPGQPMTRDGSGTSWHPDDTPMEGTHGQLGGWQTMLHGAAFLRYSAQNVFNPGFRGGAGFSAPNWIMGMASRPLGGARTRLALRAMMTAEPFTQGGQGYRLLFQTGETYQGIPLVDRQHPHDLFAELSLTLSHALSQRAGVFMYVGFPGEPTIGPSAFMHRASARHLPDSPLGHHWQDATHVTFGVATAGFCYGPFKFDLSLFTGKEPDEDRLDFDTPRFDSYSARVAVNLSRRWSVHLATGFLRGPEASAPGEDLRRTTASVLYAGSAGRAGVFSSALVWGYNRPSVLGSLHTHPDGSAHAHTHHSPQHAFLAEGDWSGRRQSVFSRIEFVQKTGGELALPTLTAQTFWIGAYSAGTARVILEQEMLKLQAGGVATVNQVPQTLQGLYGEFPVSLQIYLRMSIR